MPTASLEGTWLGDVLHAPYDVVHHLEEAVHDAIGGAVGSCRRVAGQHRSLSAVVGLLVGRRVVLAVLHVLPFGHRQGRSTAAALTHERDPAEDSPNL